MPYRNAPLAIAMLLALTVVAFWPAYYGVLRSAPLAFHVHGISASIWIVLLGVQSWTIHQRRFALHAIAGRASLAYFPVFLAGMGAVLHSMSAATPTDPFYAVHGVHLGMLDCVAAVMVAWLFAQALAWRHDPQRHPRYMMATLLFLFSPIFGRLAGHFLPPLQMHGPAEFWKFSWAAQIGNLVALATALWLYREVPRYGRPFLVSIAAIVAQIALFPIVGRSAIFVAAFRAIGTLPLASVLATGAAIGLLAGWYGWSAGPGRRKRRSGPAGVSQM